MFASTSATVAAPIEKVWAVTTDFEGMANWVPRVARVFVDGTRATEPSGVGTVRRISPIVPVPGATIVEEITLFEAPRRLQYRSLAGVPLKDYFGDIVLTALDGGGTEITYTISATQRIPVLEQLVCKSISAVLLLCLSGPSTRRLSRRWSRQASSIETAVSRPESDRPRR